MVELKSLPPLLYVALIIPILAISMTFYSLTSVFKGIIAFASLAGAVGLTVEIAQTEERGPKWTVLFMVISIGILFAVSGVIFLNLF